MSFREKRWNVSFRQAFLILPLTLFCLLLIPAVRQLFFDHFGRWLYILFFAFSTSALLTPLMVFIAVRTGLVDTPGGRKIHTRVTLLLGCAAIIISFLIPHFLLSQGWH